METHREIRIGTAGWSYKDWDGIFYPPGMQRRKQHALEFLAQCFDVVEINTSFYGHIKPELVKVWARKVAVNPKFVFTAKLHRSFTHSPIAVMEPTSAATIKPNDEDERLAREGLEVVRNAPQERRAVMVEMAAFAEFVLERIPVMQQEWETRRANLVASGKLPDHTRPGARS